MPEVTNEQIQILVVDDESIVLSFVRDALEDEDCIVECASSANEALTVIESHQINLIITDIRMPGMDGIELVKKARAVQPDIAVIYMTGYANLNSAKDAIKQGAFDYILKPFELEEIRKAVKGAMEKLRQEAEERNSVKQIDRLSDLNQTLFKTGDRPTLCTVSLRFAMMHCRTQLGSIVFWDKAKASVTKITIVNDQPEEETLPGELSSECLAQVNNELSYEPMLVKQLEDYPLYRACPDADVARILLPKWFTEGASMIVIPVNKADVHLGEIIIGFPVNTGALTGTDTKLLTILANQLALSLENLELLEETQKAYQRLRKLQDKTIQLEKMAARGEMSAEVGHELNNFLGVVSGNLSMLQHHRQKNNNDQLDKYIRATIENVEKLKKFTSNLMELTSISSQKEIIHFDKLLSEVIDYLKPQKRFQGVTISPISVDSEIPFDADSTHIQQLLYNLFNNAADATVDGEKREIGVRCKVNRDNNAFSFCISDTGPGIQPELRGKLFSERFTTKSSGHGYGLVVCKRIVDGHGGEIHVDSAPGSGTTIRIDFPLAQSPTAETRPITPDRSSAALP